MKFVAFDSRDYETATENGRTFANWSETCTWVWQGCISRKETPLVRLDTDDAITSSTQRRTSFLLIRILIQYFIPIRSSPASGTREGTRVDRYFVQVTGSIMLSQLGDAVIFFSAFQNINSPKRHDVKFCQLSPSTLTRLIHSVIHWHRRLSFHDWYVLLEELFQYTRHQGNYHFAIIDPNHFDTNKNSTFSTTVAHKEPRYEDLCYFKVT